MSRLRRLVTVAALSAGAGLLVAGPLVPPAMASASSTFEKDVQTTGNTERTDRDLKAVKLSSCLDKFAEAQAQAMADQERMFHQELGPILDTCDLSEVAENVAFGFLSGQETTDAWMASPGHRKNLLNSKHRLIGVGAVQDVDGNWYISEVLGKAA